MIADRPSQPQQLRKRVSDETDPAPGLGAAFCVVITFLGVPDHGCTSDLGNPIRAVLYIRPFSGDRVDEPLAIKNQRAQLQKFCAQKGWDLVGEYVDTLESVAGNRPGFNKMLADATNGMLRFERLVVRSYCRFDRDPVQAEFAMGSLRTRGIEVVSANQEIQTGGSAVRMAQLIALFDEHSSKKRSQNAKRSLRENAKQGFWCGGRIPYPDHQLREQLHAIVDEMLAPFGKTSPRNGFSLLAGPQPFDISKPNMHDTKAEFLCELKLVSENLERINSIVYSFVPDEEDGETAAAARRLNAVIDAKMKTKADGLAATQSRDLIRKNVADFGGYIGSVYILLDLQQALASRLDELNEQRERFWSIRHRAPDYYARAIANRLAKLYARETGQRPTVGAHPERGQPSTGFTRALQQVFVLLEISCDVRSPAKWAVENLKDEDLVEPRNALASVYGAGTEPQSTRETIAELLAKRRED